MKILFSFLLFLVGCSALSFAQNTLNVTIGPNVCVDHFELQLNTGDPVLLEAGCTGTYTYKIGNNVTQSITVNETVCPAGVVTPVTFNDGSAGTVDLRRVGRITFKAKEGATFF